MIWNLTVLCQTLALAKRNLWLSSGPMVRHNCHWNPSPRILRLLSHFKQKKTVNIGPLTLHSQEMSMTFNMERIQFSFHYTHSILMTGIIEWILTRYNHYLNSAKMKCWLRNTTTDNVILNNKTSMASMLTQYLHLCYMS